MKRPHFRRGEALLRPYEMTIIISPKMRPNILALVNAKCVSPALICPLCWPPKQPPHAYWT